RPPHPARRPRGRDRHRLRVQPAADRARGARGGWRLSERGRPGRARRGEQGRLSRVKEAQPQEPTQTGAHMTQDPYPSRVADQPTMLPRLDPVVWRDPRFPCPIPEAQVSAYERDGFMVLENVFDASEVAALRRHAEALRAEQARLQPGTVIREPG